MRRLKGGLMGCSGLLSGLLDALVKQNSSRKCCDSVRTCSLPCPIVDCRPWAWVLVFEILVRALRV